MTPKRRIFSNEHTIEKEDNENFIENSEKCESEPQEDS